MALEETFADLVVKWRRLHDVFQALRITMVEDQPLSGGVLLIERCSDAVENLFGWVEGGLAAAVEAQEAMGATHDFNRARRALIASQQRFGQLNDQFLEFTSFDQVTELMRFGRKRRGEWLAWVKTVRNASAQCSVPMRDVRDTLVRAWHELAEHAGTASVSVQTTTIGQQISTTTPEVHDGTAHNGLR